MQFFSILIKISYQYFSLYINIADNNTIFSMVYFTF